MVMKRDIKIASFDFRQLRRAGRRQDAARAEDKMLRQPAVLCM
jgi:hypothetical protein